MVDKRKELIEAYFDHWRATKANPQSPAADELFWAWDEVTDLVTRSPTEGLRITMDLIHAAPSTEALMYVAAGPLEDLLSEFGEDVIADIAALAPEDAKLGLALRGVWGQNRMKPSVIEALRQVAKMLPPI